MGEEYFQCKFDWEDPEEFGVPSLRVYFPNLDVSIAEKIARRNAQARGDCEAKSPYGLKNHLRKL